MISEPLKQPQRRYHSEIRANQAARTRSKILEAAARLFADSGYQGTSLSDIAREAGVSLETVKLCGPKAHLLIAAFELSFAGREGMQSLATYDTVVSITAERDHERYLDRIIQFVTESNSNSSRLWVTLTAAAASDATLGKSLAALQSRRQGDIRVFVEELISRGLIQEPASVERTVAEVSFLLSPEGFLQLVQESGWPLPEYAAWLKRALLLLIGSGATRTLRRGGPDPLSHQEPERQQGGNAEQGAPHDEQVR